MPNPEANPGAPESLETLHGIVFEPIIVKDKPAGWKSSSPDRKMVRLHESSVTPRPGIKYEVEIVEDTHPNDSKTGTYFVRIKDDVSPLSVEEEQAWQQVDTNVDTAEGLIREASQSSKAVNELSAVDEAKKAAEEAVGLEKMEKFPGANKKTKGKSTRLQKKFGPQEGSLAGSVLKETIEGAKKTNEELLKQSGELLSRTPEGKAEEGRETEFAATEALVKLRKQNLKEAVEKISYLESEREDLVALKLEMRKSFTKKSANNQIISSAELEAYKKLEEQTAKIDDDVKIETQKTPEAWYGYNIRKLREYRKQYSEGKIVELPSVMEKAEKIASRLGAGQPVFIHGHLGSGKTELARYISNNYLGKNFHMISGSRHMSPSEIYGHDILTVANDIEDDSTATLDKRIELRLNKWEQENSARLMPLEANEREGERNRAQQRIIASLESGATISEFYTGPIYRAMENGEPLIIDELNAIPHDILIGLNDLLTKRPGDKVKIQQDSGREIIVKEGYCVIMTGNLNTGDLQRYVDRKDLDPAFVSRLHSEEYDYLPQKKEGLYGEQDEEDELFTLMNVMVMDRQGNIKLPEKSEEKMWNLAKASKIFQDVFSNKQIESKWFLQTSGVTTSKKPELHSTVMSLRNLKRIFDEWRNDGYSKELDYYLYENFIGTSTNPNDKAYIYQILQKQFGFFQSEGWNQTPNFGDGKASLASFDIDVPSNNLNSPVSFMSPRQTVDAVFGDKAPERKSWPRISILTEIDAEEVAEGVKAKLGGKEAPLMSAEGVALLNAFLGQTYIRWGVKKEDLPATKLELIDPKELDYKEKAEHPDQARFGEYTLNPEILGVDFEKAKVFIPDLSFLRNGELHEVFKYVVDTYGEKYYVPGIEYWKWVTENPDKAVEAAMKQNCDIKDGNYYYLPGSSLCDSGGRWVVPTAHWANSIFVRDGRSLGSEWESDDRVLLLER